MGIGVNCIYYYTQHSADHSDTINTWVVVAHCACHISMTELHKKKGDIFKRQVHPEDLSRLGYPPVILSGPVCSTNSAKNILVKMRF